MKTTNFKSSKTRRNLIGAALIALMTGFASSLPAEQFIFQGAVIHTIASGTITNGRVFVTDGKIEKVEAGETPLANPSGTVIELKGAHLYPGMIALDSALGLSEIDAVRSTQDTTEVGEYTPDVQSWVAVNPDSELIPVARANGITHAETVPQGGVVAGLSGVISLVGWTSEQMAMKRPAALHVYWPEMDLNTTPKEQFKDKAKFKSLEEQAKERQAKLKALDDFFLDARAYATMRDTATNGQKLEINPPWEAMLPVVRGEIPIMVHAADLRQIKAAIKWSQTNSYKIILVGARDAWMLADTLAKQKIPVIYEFTFDQPRHDFDAYDANFKAPSVLQKAGVTVAFASGNDSFHAAMARNLPYFASQSVAFGLPEEEALKGLTIYPAQLLRIEKRLGSIEPGKDATFFICDGDILDLRTHVQRMWIAGEEVSLASKHTRLYEKYKNRPRSK